MTIDEAIRSRKTVKIKTDPYKPRPATGNRQFKETVQEMINLAGNAPFHYESSSRYRKKNHSRAVEPWRFHVLNDINCRSLLKLLNQEKPVKAGEGIRKMLSAARALILVNWIPEGRSRGRQKYYPSVKNTEHVAATAAAIQNFLLVATDRGITNYWSSGGVLRKKKVFNMLGIPSDERLLGAVFLFPDTETEEIDIATGKNRDKRSEAMEWTNWIEIGNNAKAG